VFSALRLRHNCSHTPKYAPHYAAAQALKTLTTNEFSRGEGGLEIFKPTNLKHKQNFES
jgi:hypothetical protein